MATVHFTLHAQRLLAAGKTSQAATVLEEGIKEFPDYATAYALLARAYLQLHDVPMAYDVAASAVARFPVHRGLRLLYEQLSSLIASTPTIAGLPISAPTTPATAQDDSTSATEPETASSPPNDEEAFAPLTAQDTDTLPTEAATEPVSETVPMRDAQTESDITEPESPPQLQPDSASNDAGDALDTTAESITTDHSTPLASESAPVEQPASSEPEPLTVAAEHLPATYTLRLVETATLDRRALRMVRSSNIRLIPGLEFAPLRIETTRPMDVATVEYPPFRPIRGSQRQQHRTRAAVPLTPTDLENDLRARAVEPTEPSPQKTSLELLAERLEQVRIKSPGTDTTSAPPAPSSTDSDEPTVVSETMAAIYEQQGAIEQAIKAYTVLARLHPERRAAFEEKIAQLRQLRR